MSYKVIILTTFVQDKKYQSTDKMILTTVPKDFMNSINQSDLFLRLHETFVQGGKNHDFSCLTLITPAVVPKGCTLF